MRRNVHCPGCGRFHLHHACGPQEVPSGIVTTRCHNCKKFVRYDAGAGTVKMISHEEFQAEGALTGKEQPQ